jgi:colicin import membrane protein
MTASALADSPLLASRERLWPVLMVSLAAHAALILAATFLRPAPPIDLQQKPIVARLVRLGPKRPEHFLPRKEAAPPPAASSPTAQPVPAPPAPPAPKVATVPTKAAAPAPKAPKAPKVRGPAKPSARSDVLASVMSRMERDKASAEPVWGDPEGDPMGDTDEASAGDRYLGLVERSLRESYVLPSTISERDRMYLKATVVLYLDSDGRVLRYAFETRSGNGAFDAALERAIRAARLPPPPAELRQKYRNEGLGVLYRP